MDQLGLWFSATIDHVKQYWSKHILPFIATTVGMSVLGGLAAGAFFLLPMLFGALGAATGDDAVTGVLGVLGVALGGLFAFLLSLLLPPLFLAHVRLALQLERGDPDARYALGYAYKRLPAVLVTILGMVLLNLVGVLFCFVGVYVTNALTFFALAALADRDRGGIDALRTSVELAKSRVLPLIVFAFGLGILGMLLALVPFVGGFLTFVLTMTAPVVVYERIRQDAGEVAGG